MSRPLVVRFGALGDMVLMTCAIRRLSERFESQVDVLGSGEWTRPLLQGQAGVGEIYLLRSRRQPYGLAPDQWRLVGNLRRRGAGPTWLFDSQNAKVSGLLSRAGWGGEHLLTLEHLPDIAGEHFCDRWSRFVGLGPESEANSSVTSRTPAHAARAYPALRVADAVRAEATSWLRGRGIDERPCILIQAGNKRTMRRGDRQRASNTKYWSEQNWATVLSGLRALHPGHALLLLGAAREDQMNDEILARANLPGAHNLARDMSIPRLMALSERAVGMISVDTGPAHVASAIGCPVLTLFDSPAKCAMYAPRGPGPSAFCIIGGTDARPSMRGITTDAVLAAWQDMDAPRLFAAESPGPLSRSTNLTNDSQAARGTVQCGALIPLECFSRDR